MTQTLLLLHGFTGSGDDWKHVFAEPLPGYRVLAPDLPGHGRSINPPHTLTFADAARDMFGLLDKAGIDRVRAIGMSAGANTLLHMATQQPQRIEAMVHVSGTPRFPEQARALMRQMADAPSTDERFARYCRAFAEDYEDMNFTAATLATISARTLIVHGDRDPLYPVELAVELFRGIPNAALWVVPNGGHGPIFGDQAPPFVEAVRRFF